MNTAHPFTPESVMAFLDGELFATGSAPLSAHLNSCAECSTLAAQLRSSSGRLAAWPIEPLSPASISRISLKLSSAFGPPRPLISRLHFFRRRWFLALAGAGCLALVFIGFQSGQLQRAPLSVSVDHAVVRQSGEGLSLSSQPENNELRALRAEQAMLSSNLEIKSGNVARGRFGARAATPTPVAPMIARIAELSIVVNEFSSARASLDSLLSRHHGYAAQLSVSGDATTSKSLEASLRIPVANLDSALSELKTFGHVERESQSGEEVSMQHADLVARISNARETESRLRDILRTRTGKVSDVLEVEEQISTTRGEIEQMEAEQKTLEHRVDFATINLSFSTEFRDRLGSLAPSARTRFRNALISGYRDARDSLFTLVVWLLSLAPTLILWSAIVFFPIRWLWRRWCSVYAHAAV